MEITFLLLVITCIFDGTTSQNSLYGQYETEVMDPEVYCHRRKDNELFRRQLPPEATYEDYITHCKKFYGCKPGNFGSRSIYNDECAHLLFFDVDRQTCAYRRSVKNCDKLDKTHDPLPFWPLADDEASACNETSIQCGSSECIDKSLFCDRYFDCADRSDENICELGLDPNPTARCDPAACEEINSLNNDSSTTPYSFCYCSTDGSAIPGNLAADEIPQMILLTFNGAITERSYRIYDDLFKDTLLNHGTDCSVKATFFVSHSYTNYSAVQDLHERGHEIGVYSITNNGTAEYWENLDEEGFRSEFDGMRIFTELFSEIVDGSIVGMRVPNERSGGNEQFYMMEANNFLYDSSIVASRGRLPIWPYTLDFAIPHKCPNQKCPSKSFKKWVVPLTELDRRDNVHHEEELTGCVYLDACGIGDRAESLKTILNNNLRHHMETNRAPLVLPFTAGFFDSKPEYFKVFKEWLQETASKPPYQFVTITQALEWMVNPQKLGTINNFKPWTDEGICKGKTQHYSCSIPNPCKMKPRVREISDENVFLYTCQDCPSQYPWLDNYYEIYSEYYDAGNEFYVQ